MEQADVKSVSVPAIHRAIRVFDLLAHSRRGLTVSEISRSLGLPKSSTHRILTTLEQEHCVQKNAQTGRYYFGTKLFHLNKAALKGLALREAAKPFLISLMQRTGMTVHMAVLESRQAVIVERISPTQQTIVGTWVGRAMDVHSTAVGKALIAFLSPEEFAREIGPAMLVRHNGNTIIKMSQLKRELENIRQLGYSVDNEEDELGGRCVGAPIFDRDGRVAAAISVNSPTENMPENRIRHTAGVVMQTAVSICSRLGSNTTLLLEKLWNHGPAISSSLRAR